MTVLPKAWVQSSVVIGRQIRHSIEWLDHEVEVEIRPVVPWCCRNNLVDERMTMIGQYNDDADNGDADSAYFDKTEVA